MMKWTVATSVVIAMTCLNATVAQAAELPTMYQTLGGKENIRGLMDDFVGRLKTDPVIGRYFLNTSAERLASQLTDQVCEATGGPCKYVGQDMKAAHAGMNIRAADFNRLVEVLQDSMDSKKVPFGLQTKILAMLAPMHRDMVVSQ